MGVDGVEGEFWRGEEFDDFRPGRSEFAAESFVLRLGDREIRSVIKTQLAPVGDSFREIPSGGFRRAYENALQRAHHGVSVESGLSGCGQRSSPDWNDFKAGAANAEIVSAISFAPAGLVVSRLRFPRLAPRRGSIQQGLRPVRLLLPCGIDLKSANRLRLSLL